jgi:hypothetical protein
VRGLGKNIPSKLARMGLRPALSSASLVQIDLSNCCYGQPEGNQRQDREFIRSLSRRLNRQGGAQDSRLIKMLAQDLCADRQSLR